MGYRYYRGRRRNGDLALAGPGERGSPPGAASSSPSSKKYTLPLLALLAAAALGMWLLLPGGALHAQDNGPIKYEENGTRSVATFTGPDPEGRPVYWSLLENLDGSPEIDGTALVATDFEDYGDFSISADGVLTFNIPPDREVPDDEGTNNEYKIVVVASDDAPGAGTTDDSIQMGYRKVVIEVTGVDEPGTITLSSRQPQTSVALTATLTDPEVSNPTVTWKWEKSQDMSSGWELVRGTESAYTPVKADEGYYLRVSATYEDGDGNELTVRAVSAARVRAAPGTTDTAATFPTGSDARSVDENSPVGTNVGKPVAATDTSDDVLTYSLSGDDDDRYVIDPVSGQITVGPRANLNHETNETDSVTVSVLEAGKTAAVTQAVTITVKDVNEAPMVTGGVTMREIAEYDADTADADKATETTRATTVSTYTAGDPEESTALKWSKKGADADLFSIGETGVLTFKKVPSYEDPKDAGGDNTYNVTVVVTDDGVDADGENKMTAERAVVIKVTNLEEAGTVTLSAQQPKSGVELTAGVTDLDGGVDMAGVKWTWERDDDREDLEENAGMEEVIKGATSATYTPTDDDVGKYLRAIATYTDNKGKDRAMATSMHVVLARGDHEPEFADDETGKRKIPEGTKAVTADDTTAADDSGGADNVGAPVAATDGDEDDILTYSLGGPDASKFRVRQDNPGTTDVNEGGQIEVADGTKLDHETKSTYMVTVIVRDPGGLSASIDVTITVTDVNEPPTLSGSGRDCEENSAEDGYDCKYEENGTRSVATFTGPDPEGRPVYWSLLENLDGSPEIDGTALVATDFEDYGDFSISADGVLTFNIPPDREVPDDEGTNNEYKIVVVASDDAPGAGTTDDSIQMGYRKVVIEVTGVDEPGTITLSSRQPQTSVALTATLTDPEVSNPTVTWKWEKSRSRSSGWSLANAEATTESAYTPVKADEGYYLRVSATYEDGDGNELTVRAVSAARVRATPSETSADATFPTGSDARSVDENSPVGTNVGKPVAATDTSGDVLTYSLTANAGGFRIDPVTGQITVGPRTVMDHETTASHSVTVTVTEADGDPVTQAVTITVKDVNEAPMVTGGVTMREIAEYDADTADADKATETTRATTVSTYTAGDPEESTALKWSKKGADADLFSIGETGVLTFKKVPSYEDPKDAGGDNTYNVTVVVTDDGVDADGENKMTAERAVVIKVTNLEEAGTVTLSAQQPKSGVELTAGVTDLDGGVDMAGVKWTWERDDDREDLEENAGMEEVIKGATSATYTPTDDDVGKYLRAIATYTDNKGKDRAMATSMHVVLARGDHEPEFADDETGKRKIPEGTKAVTADDTTAADDSGGADNVGAPVAATDGDEDDILTYSLGGPDASKFRVRQDNPGTTDVNEGGQIEVADGTKLDHETKSTYMVTVIVRDPGGLSASIDVTITVTDVNEPPEIMLGGLAISGLTSVSHEENDSAAVGTYTVAGPDAATATWTLEGDDGGDFVLEGSGTSRMLKFASLPDYENAADADADNIYMVTVKADDGTYEDTHEVTVMVMNVEEAGTLTLSSSRPAVGVELTAMLTDLDGMVSGEIWQWARGNDDGTYTDIPGATSASYTPVAEDGGKHLRVTVEYTDGYDSGNTEMKISDNVVTAGDPLVVRYDANNNGMVDKDEVIRAINEYLFEEGDDPPSKDDVVKLINCYLFGC